MATKRKPSSPDCSHFASFHSSSKPILKSVVILISGRGSNLQALLDARLPVRFAAVISNRPAAGGLALATAHGIPATVIDHTQYRDRDAFDAALNDAIASHSPDLVLLAGFMRVLTTALVERYRGRLINIHPSLLPAFPGLDTHAQALAAGVKIHGCSVHFVTADLDHGPIIAQAAVPVLDGDSVETLSARVLRQEHRLYPQVVRWFVDDRLRIADDGRVLLLAPAASADADATVLCSPSDQ